MPSTATDRLQGLTTSVAVKAPCKVASTTSLTLSGEQTVGGVSCVTGDRVLYALTGGSVSNGIWVVSTGAWSRATDFDGSRDVVTGTVILVAPGTVDTAFYCVTTSGDIQPGTTTIEIEPLSEDGALLLSDLASAANASKGAGQVGFDYGLNYGTTTTGFIIKRRVYADRFTGVDPTGTSDSTTGLGLAVAELQSMGGGELILSAGDYKALNWSVPSEIKVIGQGKSATRIIKATAGVSNYCVKFEGSTGSSSALASNATAGEYTCTVGDASLWSAGSWALLREDTYVSGSAGRKQQILRVKSVNTTTDVVTFTQPILESYTTAASATLLQLSAVSDAGLFDLVLQGINSSSSGGCLLAKYVTRFEADEVHAQYFSAPGGLILQTAYDSHVSFSSARDGVDLATQGQGYGLVADEATAFSDFSDCYTENVRENMLTNRTTHSAFRSCRAVGSYDSGFNTHGSFVTHSKIMDCEVIGTVSGSGITVGFGSHTAGDTDILIQGNRVRYPNSNAYTVNAPAGKENLRVVVEGNVAYHVGVGSANSIGYLFQYSNNCRSADNVVDGVTTNVTEGFYILNCDDFKSSDDTARNIPNGRGFRYENLTDAVLSNPVAVDCSSSNFRGDGTNVRVFINGRVMDDTTETVGTGAAHSGLTQRGKYTFTFSAVSTKTETVTFPAAFPTGTVPFVTATPEKDSLGNWRCEVAEATNTGVAITLVDVGGTNRTGSPKVTWVAVS